MSDIDQSEFKPFLVSSNVSLGDLSVISKKKRGYDLKRRTNFLRTLPKASVVRGSVISKLCWKSDNAKDPITAIACMDDRVFILYEDSIVINSYNLNNGKAMHEISLNRGSIPIRMCASKNFLYVLCKDEGNRHQQFVYRIGLSGDMWTYDVDAELGTTCKFISCGLIDTHFYLYSKDTMNVYCIEVATKKIATQVSLREAPFGVASLQAFDENTFFFTLYHEPGIMEYRSGANLEHLFDTIGDSKEIPLVWEFAVLPNKKIVGSSGHEEGISLHKLSKNLEEDEHARLLGFTANTKQFGHFCTNSKGDVFAASNEGDELFFLPSFEALF